MRTRTLRAASFGTRFLCVAAFALSLPASSSAEEGKKKLATEDLTAEPPLAGRPVSGLAWRPDGNSFTYIVRKGSEDQAVAELWLEDTATGRKQLVVADTSLVLPVDPDSAEVAPAVKEERRAPRKASLEGSSWSPDSATLLLTGNEELWLYPTSSRRLERLTRAPGAEEHPSFSPDGKRIAFVRKNDLYVLDLATRAETRLTEDGGELILNGKLDWVYEEELASRNSRAYQWAPDGRSIAYLRLDDGPVDRFPITDFLPVPAKVEWQRYPKAGTANPIPSLHVVAVDGTPRAAAHVGGDNDAYIVPGFSWTPDSKSVCYRTLNRAQNRQKVLLLSPSAGLAAGRTLFVEEDPYWINVFDPPRFLPGGRYLWKSERTGYAHLYVGDVAGGELRPITGGDWMVDRVIGVDEKKGLVYFTATEENVRRRPIYRVSLNGKGFAKLRESRGTHSAELSPDGRYLLDTHSSLTQSPVLSLLDSSGRSLRVVDRPENGLAEYDLAMTEELEIPAEDGARLYARLVKPADFDPSRKYPVIVYVYGGPHAQVVRDSWGATSLLDHHLAQKGYLVWSLDNRGSWGRGHAWESAIFRSAGKRELADQLTGVKYLKSLPYVDGARIGIWGWSYGGYMTLFSLTNAPDVWKCGVAGAPVTHWKFYDTIYTERYMRTPKENPEGYEASAPLSKATDLKAALLLIHGTADDNVHLQNTLAFVDALVKAGKPYALQLQPGQKHGIRGPKSLNFRNEAIVKFFEENL